MVNMPSTLRGRLDRTFKLLICEALVGAASAVALFFFSLAAYDFLSEKYSAMVAALVLGGAYMVLSKVPIRFTAINPTLTSPIVDLDQGSQSI
jgi:hypothetical protein